MLLMLMEYGEEKRDENGTEGAAAFRDTDLAVCVSKLSEGGILRLSVNGGGREGKELHCGQGSLGVGTVKEGISTITGLGA